MHSFVSDRDRVMELSDGQGVFYLNQAAPFGGVKASGHGRFGVSTSTPDPYG